MTRISLDPPPTVLNRIARWWSRRTYGAVLEPGAATGHNPRVLLSYVRFETSLAKWNQLEPTLKSLAVMAAAHRIGCSWCLDFGYWEFATKGISRAKLEAVPRWRESDAFTDTERLVLDYAERMSGEVAEVTDDLVADLLARLGEAALVELTMMIAVENQRSRFNSALGLTSQGFKDKCEIPA